MFAALLEKYFCNKRKNVGVRHLTGADWICLGGAIGEHLQNKYFCLQTSNLSSMKKFVKIYG